MGKKGRVTICYPEDMKSQLHHSGKDFSICFCTLCVTRAGYQRPGNLESREIYLFQFQMLRSSRPGDPHLVKSIVCSPTVGEKDPRADV